MAALLSGGSTISNKKSAMQVKVKAAQMTKYGFWSKKIQPNIVAIPTVEKRSMLPARKLNGAKRITKKRVASISKKRGKSNFLISPIFLCFGEFLMVNEVDDAVFGEEDDRSD